MLAIILLIVLLLLYFQFSDFLTANSPLMLHPIGWTSKMEPESIVLNGSLKITNPHPKMEVMVPELSLNPILLGNQDLNSLDINIEIKPEHSQLKPRLDNYWQAFIVKKNEPIFVNIKITIKNKENPNNIHDIESIWIETNWVNYGPFGRDERRDGFIVPLDFPKRSIKINNGKSSAYNYSTISIKTHKLGILDNLTEVVDKYTSQVLLPNDILTIGETPLAVIQGRYHHPSKLKLTFLSKFLCIFFHPTSSLATACGMQTLINEVGSIRVIFSWIVASFFKILKVKGIFYRLAGEQARLIDDITGTTPPYDQMIVLGPKRSKECCQELSEHLGVEVAVVDVNDLGRVKILASSKGANHLIIKQALRSNPAGNADEQTPLVIVRPC